MPQFTEFPWPALARMSDPDLALLATYLEWYPHYKEDQPKLGLEDGALFQGPGHETPGLFFQASGRMAVAGRLPNGLYAEPVYTTLGMILGESIWPGVRTIPQRIWATHDVSGWLLPRAKIRAAGEAIPTLGAALETIGWMRRGLAVLLQTSKSTFGLSGATFPVLASMIMASDVLKFRKGETVITADRPEARAPCQGFYLLVGGGLDLTAPDGVHLTALPPGSTFGGTAQRGLQVEPATVTARVDSVVIRVPAMAMRAAISASPSLRSAVAGWPALEGRLKEIVEVLLFVGDTTFPMRQLVDLLAQAANDPDPDLNYDDRVAVIRLVPKDAEPPDAPVQGPDKVWRGTMRLDPAHLPTAAEFGAIKRLGNLEYIFLDASGVDPKYLPLLRDSITRAVLVSSDPWKAPPFPLGPGRINWCVQLTDRPVMLDPPYAPTAVRVKFNMESIQRASSLKSLGAADQERFARWFRSITERRVGIALGGGGSWGFAHTTLIRAIRKARIPIDMVSGSSFGSMCGAFWCATEDTSFQALYDFAKTAQSSTRKAFFSSVFMERDVNRALRHATHSPENLRLEHLEVPLFPVATNIAAGCEQVIGSGTVGFGVRCSSSFPGIITPTTGEGYRFVDGGIIRNVPTTPLANQGANLLIASNIVASPAYKSAAKPWFKGKAGRVLHEFNLWARAEDTMRSALILMHSAGEATATEADVYFASEPVDFLPTTLTDGAKIAAAAEDEVQDLMPLIEMRWKTLKARDL